MAFEQRLQVKMLQKLILTPQLQQAIKLLQLPQLELSQTLNNELMENPFLEESADDFEGVDEKDSTDVQDMTDPADTMDVVDDTEAPLEKLAGVGIDDYFENRSYDGRDLGYFSPDNTPLQSLEQYVSEGTDLYDHLDWQLRFMDIKPELKEAAEAVIGNIDERGYLISSVEDMAKFTDTDEANVQEAITLVQGFDPPGIAARDLKECLIIQIRQLDLGGSLVESLILNNLKDIQRRKFQAMASQNKCTVADIKQAIHVIEGLEPKPGSGFTSAAPIYIKPDVYVVKDVEDYRITLNDESVPNIRINSYYKKILSQKNVLERDEKEYLNERLRSAVWLLKSLDHRNKTIYRVTESIVRFQRDFFDNNIAHMKPLNLKDVAQDLGMHESTISRATSNKYLSCSHGLFNFRFFFSTGLKTDSGTVSSTYVKDLIKNIIEEEDVRKPLSDQKISDLLSKSNIKVARRTVAKYREEMNISSNTLRKSID